MSISQALPSTTIVYGIESGHFEAQSVLAIECLRRFGGRFANVPVLAITPRQGPSLTHETLRRFDDLGVTYLYKDTGNAYSWYPYMNKALAAMLAEDQASTEQIVFLDADTLIVQEPEGLWLADDTDFAVCSIDKNVGTSGPGDKNEPYWAALSQYYGIDIDRLPWIETEVEKAKVRFRLHSGVFAFRRASRLGQGFLDACERMIASRIGYSSTLPFPGDDVALAFAVVLLNLRWKLLPEAYNYEITPASSVYRQDKLRDARILHYHDCMTEPDECVWALNEISSQLPELYDWLKDRAPIDRNIGGPYRKLIRRALREWRGLQEYRVVAECKACI